MKEDKLNRRQVLELLVFLPVGLATGWTIGGRDQISKPTALSPEESLEKLVILLGPWSPDEKNIAEDVAKRFVNSEHAGGSYLSESSEVIQALATRFPDPESHLKRVDLRNLTNQEQELLMNLVRHLYSLIEVRFLSSNEPPAGECLMDALRHTLDPTRLEP